ncbi:MAG TPA: hypothetical protein VES88_09190 [Gemmatimonadaceae bacterium]|nr:hypothetical protein [Gemmatimonadaceae bacterium]
MSNINSRIMWPAVALVALVSLGGGWALGRSGVNPLRVATAVAGPMDSTAIALSSHQRCGSLSADKKVDCYSKILDSLAARGEVRVAMGALARLGTLDVDVKRDGHVFAHGIGITAGKRGDDVAKTFAMCDESNQSGCYHGVIQAYFDEAKAIGPKEVNDLCNAFRGPNADRWLLFQCVHGEGHGLTMIYDHDLPKALEGCDQLLDLWDRRSCYGGAFMENIVNVTNPHHPAKDLGSKHDGQMAGMDHGSHSKFKAMDPKDPLYPCAIMPGKYLTSCYEMQTSVMLHLNRGDMGDAAKTCDRAPGKMVYVCYQSLGRDISSYSLQDHDKAIEMCSLGTKKYQPWCYVGVVKNFVDLNARSSDGLSFCRKITAEANKVKCYDAVGEQIGTLRNDSEGRRNLCAPSEPAYVDACLFGARVSTFEPPPLAKLNAEAHTGS